MRPLLRLALGGNIQNIVTDNEETAKHMIGFLKQNPVLEEPHSCL